MNDVAVSDDERTRLERERDFLLRSLDDLDRERDKGAIDDESYARLHDDYTARAAAVIRALEHGAASPSPPPTSRRRRILTAVGIVAFGVIVAVSLAAALGARLPGQTSSGNGVAARGSGASASKGALTVQQRTKRLEEAVAANPDDVASRMLLARYLEAQGDLPGALQEYDEVLERDAANAEAEAQSGRILYLAAQAAVTRNPEAVEGLVQQSRSRLDRAVETNPDFPDARFFRAIVLANEYGDFTGAQNDLQRYLILAPQGQFADQARQLLAQVTNAIDGTPLPPTTTAANPTGKNRTNTK